MRADEQNAVELSTNLDGGGHENNGKHAKVKESAKIMLQNTLPESITGDLELNTAIRTRLPAHYNFEVQKTLHMIRQRSVRRVALQLPEGLQMFATTLCELLEQHAYKNDPSRRRLRTVIQADVTYGACCIDDYTALALGCDLLVHYGHSCLVPITTTQIRTLYVFVDIQFQLPHLIDSLRLNFPPKTTRKIAMVATIQFSSSLQQIKRLMLEECGYEQVDIPQIRPLSPGEILGCTSPRLPNDIDLCLYLGDGRFHLESIMIANPQLADRFYRYDPYSASLTHERYAYQEMYAMRREAIEQARLPSSRTFGVVFGTLGRQGSPAVLGWLQRRLEQRGKRCVVVLLSELTREKLERFERTVDIWIQTSCPRLSIDWGYSFGRPLLTPYEAMIALMDDTEWLHAKPQWMADSVASNNCTDCKCPPSADANYPMDFYAKYSLGPWTPNHVDMEAEERERILRRQKRQSIKLPK